MVSGLLHSPAFVVSYFETIGTKEEEENKSMNGMKLRLLVMGCILNILGTALYFSRGIVDALILPIIGIVLLVGGIIYPNREKQKAVTK